MTLKVIGAGLGRTGTNSLKLALEQLLGETCYHMFEAEQRPGDFDTWRQAAMGQMPDWSSFLAGFGATLDGPACHFWSELADVYPEAIILLSIRETDDWYRSAAGTIVEGTRSAPPGPFVEMERAIAARTGMDLLNGSEAELKRAYDEHNEQVLKGAPPNRLVVWQTGDGWASICDALGMETPDRAFPHVNSTADFRRERLQTEEGGIR